MMANTPVSKRLQIREDVVVCDTHSRINTVFHRGVIEVDSIDTVIGAVDYARSHGLKIAIAGGKHAMGGQQMCHAGILLDMRPLKRVLDFDRTNGLIKVEAGIMWDDLISEIIKMQEGIGSGSECFAIRQKPTGADRLSIGGSLSANIHGRGLRYSPFVDDIEEFELVDSKGNLLKVDRKSKLFRLAVGGYGLFGVVVSVTLRLRTRALMRRHVNRVRIEDLITTFEGLTDQGHEYGDYQFAIDNNHRDFLVDGILASYKPVAEGHGSISLDSDKRVLTKAQWNELLHLAHTNKTKAYQKYLDHYLKTDGQTYYSDTMQLSTYLDDYHRDLDKQTDSAVATELITELYMPRSRLVEFMRSARDLLLSRNANLIYGTIRLIEKDCHTYLAWAKESYACVIFNLHTEHSHSAIEASANIFRDLISLAASLDGSFYLTYHRYAKREDLDKCYPQLANFLKEKLELDPEQIFQSQWYRHYMKMYQGGYCQSNST